ncbi:MAG: PilN domain-containing protein [bacterium]
MLQLNLLSPAEKEKIKMNKFIHFIVFFGISFLALLIVFSLLLASVLFSSSIIVKSQNKLIEVRENDEKSQQLVEIETKINNVNEHINQINIKQKNSVIWTFVFEELSKLTPLGIYLNSFSYYISGNIISISGNADNRDNLLLFKKALEQSPYFDEIDSPLSNLIKQTDIDFYFTFKPIVLIEQ